MVGFAAEILQNFSFINCSRCYETKKCTNYIANDNHFASTAAKAARQMA